MKIKIGVIGCGPWSEIILKCIDNNHNYELKYLVCRNESKFKKIKNKKILVYKSFKESLLEHTPDAIFVCGDPRENCSIIKQAYKLNINCIIEKPICFNPYHYREIKRLHKLKKNKLFLNLPNLNDEKFLKLKKIIFKRKILKVNIIEGSMGPFRKNIDPIWDWGTHPLTTLYYFFNFKDTYDYKIKKIINKNKIKVYNINFKYKDIDLKILTGNYLKNKKRIIKFYFNNDEFIAYNFINKQITCTKNFKNQIKQLNNNFYSQPIDKLLNVFLKKNISSHQIKTFNCGLVAFKFLNKYFKYS